MASARGNPDWEDLYGRMSGWPGQWVPGTSPGTTVFGFVEGRLITHRNLRWCVRMAFADQSASAAAMAGTIERPSRADNPA